MGEELEWDKETVQKWGWGGDAGVNGDSFRMGQAV